MYRQIFILTLFATIIISGIANGSDLQKYCYLCRGGGVHIACSSAKSYCPENGVHLVKFNQSMIDLILQEHNLKRNEIAGGNVSGFKKACRMATMIWSNELAELAALNVKRCKMQRDYCHNTKDFLYSGQNLAISGADYYRPYAEIVKRALKNWYNEIKNARWSDMISYPSQFSKPIGHFTVMMADRNTHVGCAAVTYPQKHKNCMLNMFLITCNYATTNMISFPVYTSCRTAGAACVVGTNTKYPNLCREDERYAVNEWIRKN